MNYDIHTTFDFSHKRLIMTIIFSVSFNIIDNHSNYPAPIYTVMQIQVLLL